MGAQLALFPELEEIYRFKERMLSIYNIKGQKRARIAFTKLTDAMALSGRKVVQLIFLIFHLFKLIVIIFHMFSVFQTARRMDVTA